MIPSLVDELSGVWLLGGFFLPHSKALPNQWFWKINFLFWANGLVAACPAGCGIANWYDSHLEHILTGTQTEGTLMLIPIFFRSEDGCRFGNYHHFNGPNVHPRSISMEFLAAVLPRASWTRAQNKNKMCVIKIQIRSRGTPVELAVFGGDTIAQIKTKVFPGSLN